MITSILAILLVITSIAFMAFTVYGIPCLMIYSLIKLVRCSIHVIRLAQQFIYSTLYTVTKLLYTITDAYHATTTTTISYILIRLGYTIRPPPGPLIPSELVTTIRT